MDNIKNGMKTLLLDLSPKAYIKMMLKTYCGPFGMNFRKNALKSGAMVFYMIPLNMNTIQMGK